MASHPCLPAAGPPARLTVSHSSKRGAMRLGYISGYRPTNPRSSRSNGRRPRKKAATRLTARKDHAVTRAGSVISAVALITCYNATPHPHATEPSAEGRRDRELERAGTPGTPAPPAVPQITLVFASQALSGDKRDTGDTFWPTERQDRVRFPSFVPQSEHEAGWGGCRTLDDESPEQPDGVGDGALGRLLDDCHPAFAPTCRLRGRRRRATKNQTRQRQRVLVLPKERDVPRYLRAAGPARSPYAA
jgi:hypothetical protein